MNKYSSLTPGTFYEVMYSNERKRGFRGIVYKNEFLAEYLYETPKSYVFETLTKQKMYVSKYRIHFYRIKQAKVQPQKQVAQWNKNNRVELLAILPSRT